MFCRLEKRELPITALTFLDTETLAVVGQQLDILSLSKERTGLAPDLPDHVKHTASYRVTAVTWLGNHQLLAAGIYVNTLHGGESVHVMLYRRDGTPVRRIDFAKKIGRKTTPKPIGGIVCVGRMLWVTTSTFGSTHRDAIHRVDIEGTGHDLEELGSTDGSRSARILQSGDRVFVSPFGGPIQVWDAGSRSTFGRGYGPIAAHDGGRKVAVVRPPGNGVLLWDEDGSAWNRVGGFTLDNNYAIDSLASSPDGTWLAASQGHEVVLTNAQGRKILRHPRAGTNEITAIAFWSNERIAVAGWGTLRVWDLPHS